MFATEEEREAIRKLEEEYQAVKVEMVDDGKYEKEESDKDDETIIREHKERRKYKSMRKGEKARILYKSPTFDFVQ